MSVNHASFNRVDGTTTSDSITKPRTAGLFFAYHQIMATVE